MTGKKEIISILDTLNGTGNETSLINSHASFIQRFSHIRMFQYFTDRLCTGIKMKAIISHHPIFIIERLWQTMHIATTYVPFPYI